MDFSHINSQWLKKQKYLLNLSSLTIKGVALKELQVNLDGRGSLTELWSLPWSKEGFVQPEHIYQSAADFGVIKGWHLHQVHADQITTTRGKLQVVLVDVRANSPSFRHVNNIFMGVEKPRLLKIPPGVLHGWKALSQPEVIIINFNTHVYNPTDELKFAWDCVLADIWEPNNG